MAQVVTRAEVIYAPAGWYVRLYLDDGQQCDAQFDARRDIGMDRARQEVRRIAREWGFIVRHGLPVVMRDERR